MILYESLVLSHVIHASSSCMMTEKKNVKNGSYQSFTSLAGNNSALSITAAGLLDTSSFFPYQRHLKITPLLYGRELTVSNKN